MYGIDVTRSFGDTVLRKIGIIEVPDVGYSQLTSLDKIVFVGNQNVYEFLSIDGIIDCLSFYYDDERDLEGAYYALWRELKVASSYGDWNSEDFAFIIKFLE